MLCDFEFGVVKSCQPHLHLAPNPIRFATVVLLDFLNVIRET